MAIRLTWSARRQLLYYAVAFVAFVLIAWATYQTLFTAPATCFDGKQDGDEHGVDCGGSCSLVCQDQVHPLVVLWSRAFQIAPGTYTAAAYIDNQNVTAGARSVPYTFNLFDAQNTLIVERDGVINIPPAKTVPIIETNINTGTRSATRALFCFQYESGCSTVPQAQPVWHSANAPAVHVSNQNLASDGSSLSASIVNDTLYALQGVTVDAVLFDGTGTAVAASKSVIDVPAKGSQLVTFTWPQANLGVVRAEITILPPF